MARTTINTITWIHLIGRVPLFLCSIAYLAIAAYIAARWGPEDSNKVYRTIFAAASLAIIVDVLALALLFRKPSYIPTLIFLDIAACILAGISIPAIALSDYSYANDPNPHLHGWEKIDLVLFNLNIAIIYCHTRLGGATGTGLTPSECPPSTSGTDSGCSAGSLMMHITSTGSAYPENVWLWVADHTTDDPNWTDDGNDMVQNSIYNARGFLIESTAATWLYGTASEHSVYYQSNINNAKYLFAGMIQTESRYYQPTPTPPAPFANDVGVFSSDPSFSCKAGEAGCDESWAVMIRNSEDVFIAGAGLYSWFSTYSQACVDSSDCQRTLVYMETNKMLLSIT